MMHNWYFFGMHFWWWVIFIIILYFSSKNLLTPTKKQPTPKEILKERLVKGEISIEEYKKLLDEISKAP